MTETGLNFVCIYLIIINLISGTLFAYDKRAAIKGLRRTPERFLHLLEILGGVFTILALIYTLRHKNKKVSYWLWTWFIAINWIIILLTQLSDLMNQINYT